MLGAIIGDLVGSRFEWDNIKVKEFDFLPKSCFITDDSIMTLAVARSILESAGDLKALGKAAVRNMQDLGRRYPEASYGGNFAFWLQQGAPRPYMSYGNGAAMRVSPCGFAAETLEEALLLARKVTEVTHNHPEGLKGAEATTAVIFLARKGLKLPQIRDFVDKAYYPMDFTLEEIRPTYDFDESCQGTVPQAIMCLLESVSFEDALRNAISLGGDSDTLGAITGAMAQAYYGIPKAIQKKALGFLEPELREIYEAFAAAYPEAGK